MSASAAHFLSLFLLLISMSLTPILKKRMPNVVPFTIPFQSLLFLLLLHPLLCSGPHCAGPMAVSPTSDVLLARWCIQRLLCRLDANWRRRPCGILGITLSVIFHVMMKMTMLMRIRGRGRGKGEREVCCCFHFLTAVSGINQLVVHHWNWG